MDIKAEKEDIIRKIKETEEESLLRSIKRLLDHPKEKVVGYTVSGEPLTQKQLIEEVLRASDDVRAGNFITQEDLEIESADW